MINRRPRICLSKLLWDIPAVVTVLSSTAVSALFGVTSVGSPQSLANSPRMFSELIRPILREHCEACHNPELKQAGFDLSTPEGLLRGGGSGPAIVSGNAKNSLLYRLITHDEQPGMPYKAPKLPQETIEQIAAWIDAGATMLSDSKLPTTVAARVDSPEERHFVEKVKPVLVSQCLLCHGGKLKQAGLDLSTREGLLRGSDNGAVVVLGDPARSRLVKKITHEDQPGMPYKGNKLGADAIANISKWIHEGALYDGPLNVA